MAGVVVPASWMVGVVVPTDVAAVAATAEKAEKAKLGPGERVARPPVPAPGLGAWLAPPCACAEDFRYLPYIFSFQTCLINRTAGRNKAIQGSTARQKRKVKIACFTSR